MKRLPKLEYIKLDEPRIRIGHLVLDEDRAFVYPPRRKKGPLHVGHRHAGHRRTAKATPRKRRTP